MAEPTFNLLAVIVAGVAAYWLGKRHGYRRGFKDGMSKTMEVAQDIPVSEKQRAFIERLLRESGEELDEDKLATIASMSRAQASNLIDRLKARKIQ